VIACLNCVENWCREIGLSVNADKTKKVLFTNNSKIGGFYNSRLFGNELRMTDQVKYLGVILNKKLDWKAHIGSIVVLWERLGDYHRRWWPLTVVSMGMRRPTHLQEWDQVLLLWGRSLVFHWQLRVSGGGSGSGYLNHTAPHGAWRLLVISREWG
jgi:hypothetical protein